MNKIVHYIGLDVHKDSIAVGAVYLPNAPDRKYPGAPREWGWQYAFPASELAVDPRSGIVRRHHVDPAVVNKAIKVAVKKAGIAKAVSAHTFRHLFLRPALPHRIPRSPYRNCLGLQG